MKKTYLITGDKKPYLFETDSENEYEVALEYLGYELTNKTDDGNVHEYNLTNRDKENVLTVVEYSYYRACVAALTELGYHCDEYEDAKPSNIVQVSFK